MGFYVAKRNAPRQAKAVTSKRAAKSGNHLGQGALRKMNPVPKVYPVMTFSSRI